MRKRACIKKRVSNIRERRHRRGERSEEENKMEETRMPKRKEKRN